MYMCHFVFIQTILVKLRQEEYYSTKQLLFHKSRRHGATQTNSFCYFPTI